MATTTFHLMPAHGAPRVVPAGRRLHRSLPRRLLGALGAMACAGLLASSTDTLDGAGVLRTAVANAVRM
jgi:hypothetical protein